MPAKQLIACGRILIVDEQTNLSSLIHIAESITISTTKLPHPAKPVNAMRPFELTGIATWRAEDGDREGEFEYRLGIELQDGTYTEASRGVFRFTRPMHRFVINAELVLPVQPGFVTFISDVRRPGESDWMSQRYAIDIRIAEEDVGDNQHS